MSKVIVLDLSVFAHKSIFMWNTMMKGKTENSFIPSTDYSYFKSIISTLKKIGVDKDDIILAVGDSRNGWRKAFLPSYKGNRKETRDAATEVDWAFHYGKIEEINRKLHFSTDWQFVKISNFISFEELKQTKEGKEFEINNYDIPGDKLFGMEADDIASVATLIFKDKDIILATIDGDWHQLTYRTNVKIFNLNTKFRGTKGSYIEVKDPLKILADKARKGDVSDNILVPENDTDKDYKLRYFLTNLLTLPTFVVDPIADVLLNLPDKTIDYDNLPFPNSIGKKENFDSIYKKENVVEYDKAVGLNLKRKERKLKVAREKAKEKREKLKMETINA